MAANPHYHSYLLRLWRDNANHPWRASLQCTANEEMHTFPDLAQLLAFLVEQLAADEETGMFVQLATWLQAQSVDAGPHEEGKAAAGK